MKFNFAQGLHIAPGRAANLSACYRWTGRWSLLFVPTVQPQHASSMFSSAGQYPIDFANMVLTRGYSGTRAYCQSE